MMPLTKQAKRHLFLQAPIRFLRIEQRPNGQWAAALGRSLSLDGVIVEGNTRKEAISNAILEHRRRRIWDALLYDAEEQVSLRMKTVYGKVVER